MLNIKPLIKLILKLANIRVVEKTASATSVAVGSTAWIGVPYPTGCKPIAVVGYYLENGIGNANEIQFPAYMFPLAVAQV